MEKQENSWTDILLTSKIKYYIANAFEVGPYCGGTPFKWDKRRQRPEIGPGWQIFHWKINMVVGLCHTLFVIFRSVQVNVDEKSSKVNAIYMRFMALYFILGGILHFGIIQNVNKFPMFVTQYLDFVEKFQRKFVIPNSRLPTLIKVVEISMKLSKYAVLTFWILMTIIAFARPLSHEQLGSVLPVWYDDGSMVWPRILSSCPMAYIHYIYFASALTFIQVGFSLLSFLAIFTEMRYSPRRSFKTREVFRAPAEILRTYRWLQLHMKWYNEVNVSLVIPAVKLLLMSWCVFCTFGAIKMEGVASAALTFVTIFSVTFLIVMFSILAEVLNRSSAVRKYLETTLASDPYLRRSVKSLPVLAVNLRGMYFVDKGMILTMIDCMIGQTVTFLLVNG